MSDDPVDRARADAAAAKQRMIDAAHALQTRLQPTSLAGDAWDAIRRRGAGALAKASSLAKARPVAASAAAIGIVGVLLRKPIGRLFRKPAQPATPTKARTRIPAKSRKSGAKR